MSIFFFIELHLSPLKKKKKQSAEHFLFDFVPDFFFQFSAVSEFDVNLT